MDGFKDLRSLLEYLDEHAMDHPFSVDIAKLFDRLRNSPPEGGAEGELRRCDWEAAVFQIQFHDGDSKETDFDSESWMSCRAYLDLRLKETANPLLKARYAHVLWRIPGKRRGQYAKAAVDSYMEVLRTFEKKTIDDPEFGFHLRLTVRNAYFLACRAKYGLDEVKSEVRRLVTDFDFANRASFQLRRNLIHLMLDSRKIKKEELADLPQVCWKLYQIIYETGRLEVAIEALELGDKVDRVLGSKTHDWTAEKAACYERLIDVYRNTPNELMYCQDALIAYKKAKNHGKVQELGRKYCQIKSAMPVATFAAEIDLTEHVSSCRRKAKELSRWPSEEIIRFLMHEKELLPQNSRLEAFVAEQSQEDHFFNRVPVTVMDDRGHIIQRFTRPEERRYLALLQHYKSFLELDKLILLREIIDEAIREGKLTCKIFLNFIEQDTWLGRKLISPKPGGRRLEYRWSDLVAPGIRECFCVFEQQLVNNAYEPDCVLGLDSITLKLEGVLRELCDSYGIPTFGPTPDKQGGQVFKEKDLNALLHEKDLEKIIDPTDLLFFKFLLVEHAGYNLRNRIAHCLMVSPQLYSPDFAVLMVFALLRLAKYPLRGEQSVSRQAGDE